MGLVLLGLLLFMHVYVLADKQVSSYSIILVYLLYIGRSSLSSTSRQAHCLKGLPAACMCRHCVAFRQPVWLFRRLQECKRVHERMCASTWHSKHTLTLGHAVARSSWTTTSFCLAVLSWSTTP